MSSEQSHQEQQQQRWNSPPPTYTNATNSNNRLTPYLTLPHHLSLTWLATPILSLIFIAFRLQISSSDARDAAEDAKRNLLASCHAAERSASVAASLPMFMAEGSNRLIEKSVNASIEVARDTMIFSLTALQGIIEFVIDMYRSVFLCFLELILRGSLSVLIGAAREISEFTTNTLNSLRTSIQSDIQKANEFIASAVRRINDIIPDFLNIQLDVPSFDIPSLSGLQNVQLPTTVQDGLTRLNSTIPTVDDIREKLDAIIAIPFNNLRAEINQSFGNIKFNATALPVPQEQKLAFCASLDTAVVDDLANDVVKIAKIGTFIILGFALLLTLGNCVIQWYKWRALKNRLEDVREGWGGDPALVHVSPVEAGVRPTLDLSDRNLLTLFSSMQHPISTSVAQRISRICRLSCQKHINLRFFFAYIFSPPAVACLLIGLFGIASVQIQLAALGPIKQHYSVVVADAINDFSKTIASDINGNMLAQSKAYATSVNNQVDTLQTSVNDGVFGWVNGTVVPLNNTLQAFYEDIQQAVNKVFGGTVLETPAQEFIRCLIGTKVQGIENALTFVQENFKVDVGKVDPEILMLSDSNVQKATEPIAQAAIGGEGENDGVVARLVNRYAEALQKEQFMFTIFLMLWGLVVVMAIIIIWWNSYGRELIFRYKKKQFDQARQERVGDDSAVTPWVATRYEIDEDVRSHHRKSSTEKEGYFDSEKTFAKPLAPPVNPKLKISYPLTRDASGSGPPPVASRTEDTVTANVAPKLGWSANSSRESVYSSKADKRGSRKLKPQGRKAMGRETLIADRDGTFGGVSVGSNNSGSSSSLTTDGGFFARIGTMFASNSAEADDDFILRSSPEDNRPAPISQPNASQIRAPQSQLRPLGPRISTRVPSSHVQLPPPPPLMTESKLSGGRGRRDVPQSVSGLSTFGISPAMNDGSILRAESNIPIHHGFVQDSQAPRIPSLRISNLPPIQSVAPRPPAIPKTQPNRQSYSSRLLTPGSARKSSLVDPSLLNLAGIGAQGNQTATPPTPAAARNPFSSPFDDEYRVSSSNDTHAARPARNSGRFPSLQNLNNNVTYGRAF